MGIGKFQFIALLFLVFAQTAPADGDEFTETPIRADFHEHRFLSSPVILGRLEGVYFEVCNQSDEASSFYWAGAGFGVGAPDRLKEGFCAILRRYGPAGVSKSISEVVFQDKFKRRLEIWKPCENVLGVDTCSNEKLGGVASFVSELIYFASPPDEVVPTPRSARVSFEYSVDGTGTVLKPAMHQGGVTIDETESKVKSSYSDLVSIKRFGTFTLSSSESENAYLLVFPRLATTEKNLSKLAVSSTADFEVLDFESAAEQVQLSSTFMKDDIPPESVTFLAVPSKISKQESYQLDIGSVKLLEGQAVLFVADVWGPKVRLDIEFWNSGIHLQMPTHEKVATISYLAGAEHCLL